MKETKIDEQQRLFRTSPLCFRFTALVVAAYCIAGCILDKLDRMQKFCVSSDYDKTESAQCSILHVWFHIRLLRQMSLECNGTRNRIFL
jgi:hypothetical protein